MWKHNNFINLQLHAPPISTTYYVNVDKFQFTLSVAGENGYSFEDNASGNSSKYTISNGKVIWSIGGKLQYNGSDVNASDTIVNDGVYTTVSGIAGETWVWNEYIDLSSGGNPDFILPMSSNDTAFLGAAIVSASKVSTINYQAHPNTTIDVYTWTSSSSYSWADEAYRTITFATPVTDESMLTFLQSNAVKQQSAPTNYIIENTELISIADSIRTKTSSEDKLTPAAMVDRIKTISAISDINDATTLAGKLTESNIGSFYRFTGTSTSNYTNGVIYKVVSD